MRIFPRILGRGRLGLGLSVVCGFEFLKASGGLVMTILIVSTETTYISHQATSWYF